MSQNTGRRVTPGAEPPSAEPLAAELPGLTSPEIASVGVAPAGIASPGRVTVDQRGHSVWQWEGTDTDSTSLLLKRLENDALELEPTRAVPIPTGAGGMRSAAGTRAPGAGATGTRRVKKGRTAGDDEIQLEATLSVRYGGGFNPYDNAPR